MSHIYGPLFRVIITIKKAPHKSLDFPDILFSHLFPLHLCRAWVTRAALVEVPHIAIIYWEIFHSFIPCIEDILLNSTCSQRLALFVVALFNLENWHVPVLPFEACFVKSAPPGHAREVAWNDLIQVVLLFRRHCFLLGSCVSVWAQTPCALSRPPRIVPAAEQLCPHNVLRCQDLCCIIR